MELSKKVIKTLVFGLALGVSATTSSQAAKLPLTGLPGQWFSNQYSNGAGTRNYYVYIPQKGSNAPLPLVVMLHGCTEDAPSFAAQTGMREIGEKYGFAVLFPEQDEKSNIKHCWNWFLPENQRRGSGELSLVVGMMGEVAKHVKLDMNRIFVGGLSAGAAMASNLVACYSDLFAGALIHSGLEYQAATNVAEAYQSMSMGSRQDLNQSGIQAAKCTGSKGRVAAILIIKGDKDSIVNPVNSNRMITQFTRMNDILDDEQNNNSQTTTAIGSRTDQVPGGYAYQSSWFGGNGKTRILSVTVQGMDHAWSGAHQAGPYADPKGPDAGDMMWLFLTQNSSRAKP